MAQNGIPNVTGEYKVMESALVSMVGSSVDLQNRFKELLTSGFSDLATKKKYNMTIFTVNKFMYSL